MEGSRRSNFLENFSFRTFRIEVKGNGEGSVFSRLRNVPIRDSFRNNNDNHFNGDCRTVIKRNMYIYQGLLMAITILYVMFLRDLCHFVITDSTTFRSPDI